MVTDIHGKTKKKQSSERLAHLLAHPLIKLQAWACGFIKKETLTEVFSCQFCEISKNTFFHRTPLVAASAMG